VFEWLFNCSNNGTLNLHYFLSLNSICADMPNVFFSCKILIVLSLCLFAVPKDVLTAPS
jgi:hypothetical protein